MSSVAARSGGQSVGSSAGASAGGTAAAGGGAAAAGGAATAGVTLAVSKGLEMAQRAANSLVGRMEQTAGHAGLSGASPYAYPAGYSRGVPPRLSNTAASAPDSSGEPPVTSVDDAPPSGENTVPGRIGSGAGVAVGSTAGVPRGVAINGRGSSSASAMGASP